MQGSKFRVFTLLGVLLVASIVLVACGTSETPTSSIPDQPTATIEEHDEGEEQEHSESEDQDTAHDDGEAEEHDHANVPEEYESLTNPVSGDPEAASAGSKLFIANCATCHGESGDGDGPASSGLDPKPAALSDTEMLKDLSDAYLFWRISEGGTMDPFNSAMPSWKGIYGDEQIWQLVNFIRTLSE